ncbi:MAG: type II toxin-antitoxin system PemK/MazF family toxin [Planctomycetes bacterium]|nr:type II toxin-antitoxin system PemK/MazF family toxin [Planctomycetota bacterium]
MVTRRGDVFWADLGEPLGSEPAFRRPVVVIQADAFNASKLATTVVLSLTSNLDLRKIPGCVFLSAQETGLPKDSVANLTQVRTLEKNRLRDHAGQLDDSTMFMIDAALRRVLGL